MSETKKVKLAVFRNLEFGFEFTAEENYKDNSEYIRISEYVTVDFPLCENQENLITAGKLYRLNKQKEDIQAKAQLELTNIDRQISDLLALTVD